MVPDEHSVDGSNAGLGRKVTDLLRAVRTVMTSCDCWLAILLGSRMSTLTALAGVAVPLIFLNVICIVLLLLLG